jgi:hypothetical protein
MNLYEFENKGADQEHVIAAEAYGESEASFARSEVDKIKSKLEKRKKQQKKTIMIFGGLGSVILILALFVAYSQYKLYKLSREEQVYSSSSVAVTASTTPEEIIRLLGKHVLLPEGNPQIAQVQDVEKLRETQAFFKNAENGDIILLYNTTIFLYRPSRDILVASGDVSGLGQTKP